MPHLAQITPSCSAEHVEGGSAKRKPGKRSGADRRRKETDKIRWLLWRKAERRDIQSQTVQEREDFKYFLCSKKTKENIKL